jgi:hypothetical protein
MSLLAKSDPFFPRFVQAVEAGEMMCFRGPNPPKTHHFAFSSRSLGWEEMENFTKNEFANKLSLFHKILEQSTREGGKGEIRYQRGRSPNILTTTRLFFHARQ